MYSANVCVWFDVDMIEAEEQRLKEREKHHEEAGHKKGRSKKNHKEHEH